ncbi:fungal-specific transcription factor domain-containing protein [Calycina marina]|uniref:Fungal-specific transcription factor domain-containing protein n=1 Tax=Calycina marina TaxID=1763456 RepID=A0A9P7YZR3_9HELO|nr:fungal-specific transcription factor domain-containing protein [Calycina marina]
MPRPKKVGGPEPKKRSRNGCWQCKTRKVKCDEIRPTCNNCQRQRETCDYSIRLNWDGRSGKKKDGPVGAPQMVISASLASTPTVMDSARSPASLSGFEQVMTFQNHISFPHSTPTIPKLEQPPNAYTPLNTEAMVRQQLTPDNSMIDPALITDVKSPTYDGLYNRGREQYTQSYERYRCSTPSHGLPTSVPPFFDHGKGEDGSTEQAERPAKRTRYQEVTSPSYDTTMPPLSVSVNVTAPYSDPSLTPASSHSDNHQKHYSYKALHVADSRRLSVNSLLSGPPGPNSVAVGDDSDSAQGRPNYADDPNHDTTTYGIDRGFKDLDIGKNDDTNAISGSSPISTREHLDLVLGEHGNSPLEFGFGVEVNSAFEIGGGYYDKPVAICIPRVLEPLPAKLLENPMNLLYFHHFLNHTAGCLIPHNCSANPFKIILPQMAVRDDNLMNLLLAYSASHRARHLGQPEPTSRIAMWVQDIFPQLRRALNDPTEIISNANLATTIMLASLEIISPKSFGVKIPWQNHLDTARQMIAARGGPQRIQAASHGDKVSSFLWSWFAYLDVLGSFSGGKVNSSSSWILNYESNTQNEVSIDCILGFTSHCVHILATIAELSRICDGSRIGPDYTIRAEWKPTDEIAAQASTLEADLAASRLYPTRPCTHMQSNGEAAYQWDSLEMVATNEAFHWAGLVHLHRRIYGKPSNHPDVQEAVREIFGALYKVRRGSSAEACLLFPMFTAGCDTKDEKQRADILERIKDVERFGMTQVRRARKLMERTWETGRPWETLVVGDFLG